MCQSCVPTHNSATYDCRRRGKERRHQRSEVSKMKGSGAKKCFEDLDQRRMERPVTHTWSTDFLLREGSSREEIGSLLLHTAECTLCKKIGSLLRISSSMYSDTAVCCLFFGSLLPCIPICCTQQSAHCARRRMRRVEAAGTESCQRRQLAIFRVRDALDKRKYLLQHTTRASGSCYRMLMGMGRRTGT